MPPGPGALGPRGFWELLYFLQMIWTCRYLTVVVRPCLRGWIQLWPWPLIGLGPTSWPCTHIRPSTFFCVGKYTELKSKILLLNGIAIENLGINCETKWFKFLGLCLHDKLSLVGQCAHVYQKASTRTFMLACLKWTVLHIIRMMIYNRLIQPYFKYCIEVWGCTKQSDLKVFSKLQKKKFSTFWGLAIGLTLILFLPATRSYRSRIWSSIGYWPLRTKHFMLPAPIPPLPWICSASQNFPIETNCLNSHIINHSTLLTTLQLEFQSFGVWKIWICGI